VADLRYGGREEPRPGAVLAGLSVGLAERRQGSVGRSGIDRGLSRTTSQVHGSSRGSAWVSAARSGGSGTAQDQAAAAKLVRATASTLLATCSAWARISGTAMISHKAPRVIGPTANRLAAGWPCASTTAP
jgi:hypothetical protein